VEKMDLFELPILEKSNVPERFRHLKWN
jgi:hypothetical protein